MATGRWDLKNFALPAYWDAAYLEKYRLVDGVTADQAVEEIGRAIALQNGLLMADPLYAGLISTTEEIVAEYRIGDTNEFKEHTEYSMPDVQRGATTGHMLPLKGYDYKFGWTWDALRKLRADQRAADVASGMDALRNIWQKKVLTRMFKSTYDPVGSGRSMPLADGGTADDKYIPVAFPERGGTFLYTHDHVKEQNGITQTLLEIEVRNLWEHGYEPPYELLIAEADISSWTNTANITGWTPRADPIIQFGSTQDVAQVPDGYIGAIQTDYGALRVRATGRVPTTYWAVYKSYGAMDARNPLRVRFSPDMPFGAVLMRGEGFREFPLENCMAYIEFGVGVQDRVSAVVVKNTAGAYADPTIA